MPTDLSPHKITLGDTDYPAKHNSMIDAVQAAINAVEVFENAVLLVEARQAAEQARWNAEQFSGIAIVNGKIAVTNRGYAEEWANKAEDSLISTAAGGDGVDDYSALHFSNKAAAANAESVNVAWFFANQLNL